MQRNGHTRRVSAIDAHVSCIHGEVVGVNTVIELSLGSSDSLKKSSTCTGACSKTALAAGLERTSNACAEPKVTAHAL